MIFQTIQIHPTFTPTTNKKKFTTLLLICLFLSSLLSVNGNDTNLSGEEPEGKKWLLQFIKFHFLHQERNKASLRYRTLRVAHRKSLAYDFYYIRQQTHISCARFIDFYRNVSRDLKEVLKLNFF